MTGLTTLAWCIGGEDGKVVVFDLATGQQASSFQAAPDTVNGLMFHPSLPLAASASGAVPLAPTLYDFSPSDQPRCKYLAQQHTPCPVSNPFCTSATAHATAHATFILALLITMPMDFHVSCLGLLLLK